MAKSITLPEGFELDDQPQPQLPDGFVLDAQPSNASDVPAPVSAALSALKSAIPGMPGGAEQSLSDFSAKNRNPIVRGAIQGADLGYADEVSGVENTVKDYLLGKMKNKSFGEGYRENRDAYRAADAAAEKENPAVFRGADMAGNLGTSVMAAPEVTTAKLMSLAGIAGLGSSNADLTTGDPVEYGKASGDTAKAMALAGIIGQAGPIINKTAEFAKTAGKRAISNIFGPSMDAVNARLANPEAIQNASSIAEVAGNVPATLKKLEDKIRIDHQELQNASTISELSGNVPATLKKLEDKIRALDDEAWSKLSDSKAIQDGAVTKDTVLNILGYAKQKIGTPVGRADKLAINALDDISHDLGKINGSTLSESEIKRVIRKMDDNIDWDNPAAKTTNEALKTFRHHLDNMLKDQNKEYAEAMVPIDDHMGLLDNAKKFFLPKRVAGKGYEPTNATLSRLDTLYNRNKDMSQGILSKLKDVTGDDYLTDVRNAKMAQQFKDGDYSTDMVPMDENMQLIEDAKKFFLPDRSGGRFKATNSTLSRLDTLDNRNKDISKGVLTKLKDVTGDDYLTDVQNAKYAQQFEGGKANGSRSVNRMGATLGFAGGVAGGAVGGWPGASIGTGLGTMIGTNFGAAIDKEGGKMAANILDYYTAHPEAFGKFSGALGEAAKRGPQSFAVTHFLLGQQSPEYQDITKKIQEGQPNE